MEIALACEEQSARTADHVNLARQYAALAEQRYGM
jgi:hypothetical protein